MNALPQDANNFELSELTLSGNSGYAIQGNRIIIAVDEIANRRDAGNLSGTLSLELWALEKPYAGGQFSGYAMAATQLGELRGEQFLSGCRYDLNFQEPPAGQWRLALMLREWDGAGYVTRSWVNFDLPFSVAEKPLITRSEKDNVINVEFPKHNKPAPQASGTETRSVAVSAEPAKNQKQGVSVNEARPEDLAAVKGMSRKLAESIIASRPFASLEDLLKVKGMGEKLLNKLRDSLKL